MGDKLAYVQLTQDEAGTWSTEELLSLNDEESLYLEAGSFKIVAPVKQSVLAQTNRRYGGVRQVGEMTENGIIEAKIGVFGGSANEALSKVGELLRQLEASPWGLLLEWKPSGATEPSLFEVRETGDWTPEYDERALTGAGLFVFAVQIPVAPLALGLPVSVYSNTDLLLPEVLELEEIPGDAPCKAEVSIQTGSSADPSGQAAAWALLGWASRPVTPTPRTATQKEEAESTSSGWDAAPFGIIEAQDYATASGWSKATNSEARGGELLRATAAKSTTTYEATYKVNPACMVPDSFSGELAVEVWARVLLAEAETEAQARVMETPTLTVSVFSGSGAEMAAPRYTDEFGSGGRVLTVPTGKTCFRLTRLGTLHMLVERMRIQPRSLAIKGTVGRETTGEWGLDYLMLVPVMQRACSPTSKELEGPHGAGGSFPRFLTGTSTTRIKSVRHDLSGWTAAPGEGGFPDTGLGGQMLEMPPGNTDLLVKLSNLVPDDPSKAEKGFPTAPCAETSESLAFVDASVEVTVTPRWLLTPSWGERVTRPRVRRCVEMSKNRT